MAWGDRMRKGSWTGLIVAALWGWLLLSQTATAAQTISIGSASGAPGQTLSLAVNYLGDGTAVGLQFDINFDSSRLQLLGVTKGPAASTFELPWSTPSPGVLRFVEYSLTNQPLVNGQLASLRLRIFPTAPAGDTTLNPQAAVIGDGAAASLVVTGLAPGAVTIQRGGGPGGGGGEAAPLPIPTLSASGLSLLVLLILIGGSLVLRKPLRRRMA